MPSCTRIALCLMSLVVLWAMPPSNIAFAESSSVTSAAHLSQNRIAYIGPDGNLWLMSSDGTALRQLTNNGGFEKPEWSPNGEYIAVIRLLSIFESEIWVFSVADFAGQIVAFMDSEPSETPANSGGVFDHVGWSDDGTLIVSSHMWAGNHTNWTWFFEFKRNEMITVQYSDSSVWCSCQIDPPNGYGEVYELDVASGERLLGLRNVVEFGDPWVSVLYRNIFVTDINFENPIELESACPESWKYSPKWSPNALHIAYACSNTIYTEELATNEYHEVHTHTTRVSSLDWSSDGTQVVFATSSEIWSVSVDGTHLEQIGDGTWPVWEPEIAQPSGRALSISTGEYHACAVDSQQDVWCWGDNSFGQLGDGTTTDRTSPVKVLGINESISTISAGEEHTCALGTSGTAYCWGNNSSGQLGNGTTSDSTLAVAVQEFPPNVQDISAGGFHTCALTNESRLYCWGDNRYGQLGNDSGTNSAVPIEVHEVNGIATAIASAWSHNCIVATDGSVYCWGNNSWGQLGMGDFEHRPLPTMVNGLPAQAIDVDLGDAHSCVTLDGGYGSCWGENTNGRLGNGSYVTSLTPVDIVGLTTQLAGISAGEFHTCGLMTNSSIQCWGANEEGELGDGSTDSNNTPTNVIGLSSDVVQVELGSEFTCALDSDGTVLCWGGNFSGQLGDGTTTRSVTPVNVLGFSGETDMAEYSISGTVTDVDGNPIEGVTISRIEYSDIVTDKDGHYVVTGLTSGRYSLAPSHEGYLFSPSDLQIEIPPSQSNVDFTGTSLSVDISELRVIQVFLTDKDSAGEHAIPLISGKPTLVRVYVNCNAFDCGSLPNIVGKLAVSNPEGTPIEIQTPSRIEATFSGRIYSFMLPNDLTSGSRTLTATIASVELAKTVDFLETQTPPILYLKVLINGIAPTDSIHTAFGWTTRVYPVNSIDQYYNLPTQSWSPPWWCLLRADSDLRKQCREHNLLAWLEDVRWEVVKNDSTLQGALLVGWIAEENQDLLPSGGAALRSVAYIGDFGATSSQYPMESPRIFAHELGHLLGREHSNTSENLSDPECRNVTDHGIDWNYQSPKIQEWGLDMVGLASGHASKYALLDPAKTYDYMSYCGELRNRNVWTAPNTYLQLIHELMETSEWARKAENKQENGPKLMLSGFIDTNDAVYLHPAWYTGVVEEEDVLPPDSLYCVVAMTESGSVSTERCFTPAFYTSESSEQTDLGYFRVTIPYDDTAVQIHIQKGEAYIASYTVSPNQPTVNLKSPNGGEIWSGQNTVTIAWTGNDPDGDELTYSVFYSPNDSDWIPVATAITKTQVSIYPSELSGGEQARIKIIASDGFNNAEDVSDAIFTVKSKPPKSYIVWPSLATNVVPGIPVVFQGYAYDLEDGILKEESVTWQSDIDGDLGAGTQLITGLSFGKHTIKFRATDRDGMQSEDSIDVFVRYRNYLPVVMN